MVSPGGTRQKTERMYRAALRWSAHEVRCLR
jgi:hypothetical protein